MDSLSIICTAVGFLIIVRRGPPIFAPNATLRFYDGWLLSTHSRIRVFGVVFATLAMALLFSDFGEEALAGLLHTFGWFMATVALLLFCVAECPPAFHSDHSRPYRKVSRREDHAHHRFLGCGVWVRADLRGDLRGLSAHAWNAAHPRN